MKQTFEAVVVGLGPAGMAAATALAECGVPVAVIDDRPSPGGQVYRQMPAQFTLRDDRLSGIRFRDGQGMFRRFNRMRNRMTLYNNSTVFAFFNDGELSMIQGEDLMDIAFHKLILCEGATERIIPFPGWTLPGILTAGGLQKMLLNQRLLPGRRVLLSGTGPLLVSVAACLSKAGAEIVALCEAASLNETLGLIPSLIRRGKILREAVSYFLPLLKNVVWIRQPFGVISASGRNHVETATIARLRRDGTPLERSAQELAVDVIGLNHGFLPASRLSRLLGCRHVFDALRGCWHPATDHCMRTNLGNVYATGDGSGIGGADMAAIGGGIAGVHAAASLGHIKRSKRDALLGVLQKERQQLAQYVNRLFSIYRLRSGLFKTIRRNTVVCRCEGVTAGQIWDEIDAGCTHLTELKPTRFSMGSCQGRMCEAVVSELMRQRGIGTEEQGQLHLRPPAVPLPISALERKSAGAD